jgi:D-aspartate ligase
VTAPKHLPPAVIVGAELNGLGVARSLRAADVPSVVLGTNWQHPAMWTRRSKCRKVGQLFGKPFIDQLLKLQQNFRDQRPILLLTEELAVGTVSTYRDQLASAFRFGLPPLHVVETLLSKSKFHPFAELHGLPIPRTIGVAQ